MATITRSPLSVTIPGNTVSPTRPDRGRITTSATPYWLVTSASVPLTGGPELATSPPSTGQVLNRVRVTHER